MWKMLNGRRLVILMVHGHRAAVKQMIPTLWNRRSRKPCPNALMGERIFKQFNDSKGEIPLCPNIDAGHRCHKEGGPDACPLWDRPKEDDPTPKMDVNPPRRTRKKRETHEN